MNFVKLLVVVAIGVGAAYYWRGQHRGAADASPMALSAPSSRGFVAMPAVTGQSSNAILVLAAENCPHEDAQRADQLAEDLVRSGLPVVRLHNVSFELNGPDASAAAEKLTAVMNGELPIVFVRGRAKSNPRLDDVVAEYKGS